MTWLGRPFFWAFSVLFLLACDPGGAPRLLPVAHQTVEVNQTLRVPLDVDNPRGLALSYAFEAPTLTAIDSVATIGGSPAGGEFRFTPLASHVGTHTITFLLSTGDGEVDRQAMVVDVTPAADAAPVFLAPGAGGTFDLERDPCVAFHVEIRDDDSTTVDVRARTALPDGAMLTATGPKTADFSWCPTPDQIAASARWTIALEADDLDHAPVPHDFVVVLRTGASSGCPGAAPTLTLRAPLEGERVTSSAGYDVSVTATDDQGLRDAPLLYWTTERPADPAMPDVTGYAQVTFVDTGAGAFVAHIPSLGLAEGEERQVFFTASVTDNDDATGTACDHRTDLLPVVSFFAVGGAGGGTAARCDACAASVECASGICVPAAGGARCLEACGAADACTSGTCGTFSTAEGSSTRACGTIAAVCDGAMTCTDDAREDDEPLAMARALAFAGTTAHVDAQICPNDDDFYRVVPAAMDRVTVAVSFTSTAGDLDLQLLDGTSRILGSSAGVGGTETVTYCARDASPLYARVLGYAGASNAYAIDVTREALACCVDDTHEPDDSRAAAHALVGTDFDGTLCPADDDWIALPIASASRVVVDLVFDAARADVDLELVGPTGTVIASSLGTTDTEHVDATVTTAGTYAIHVFSLDDTMSNDYVGMVTTTAATTCTTTLGCPTGQVCDAGACRSASCTSAAMCPASHLCPDAGPGSSPSSCSASCMVNTDCRSTEACKWFPEGRACAARGTGANGATCTTFADCGGQRACLDWPGGSCARAGCSGDSDCETGTFCVTVAGGTRVCALDCATDATRCHTGLTCRAITGTGGATRRVCAP